MILYQQFFKNFVLRKKPEIVKPVFHSLADVILPRDSLLQYLPHTSEDTGPSYEEPLLNNYPNKVNIFFDNHYDVGIGKVRPAAYNNTKAIQDYRKSHYKYNWARNLPSYLRM